MGARKVHEFGGNTFGFGSRTVLGGGWPRDPIKEQISIIYLQEIFQPNFTFEALKSPISVCSNESWCINQKYPNFTL